jgi:putative glutathione S-transferase
VTPDGSAGPTGEGGFRAEAGRYHLDAAYVCPWATRALIARKLKRLDEVVSIAIVEPALTDQRGPAARREAAARRDARRGGAGLL